MGYVSELADRMKLFFDTEDGKKYIDEILSGKRTILINLDELEKWDANLSGAIINEAIKYGIKAFEEALKEASGASDVEVGFYGDCVPFVKVHEISSKHIGKMIKIRGLVNRTHFIKPMAVRVVFKCRECGIDTMPILQESPFALTPPFGKCEGCGISKPKYDVVEELSDYIDSQEFSIQEAYEDVSGRIPQRLRLIAHKKYLINKVYCGDLVEITGVVRLIPEYRRRSKSRFNTPYMEVHHVKKKSKDPESIEISKEEEEKIIELSRKPNIYSTLVRNVAPSLYGMENCKEASLLSLFGGVIKHRNDITVRGNIHVFFIGDPSTAKSQLLRAVAELSPRGMFSSGRGATAAGLTASLNRDENGEWIIEAGVLVLADKGVACIDEIDKMRKEDRVNIHEAMASQIVSINKAGIHSTLMARTAVVAAANPTLGNYDRSKSVFANLSDFPPALFSRFDLIFILIDKPKDEFDRKVAEHIANNDEVDETIDRELFKKYIAYAKRINPTISKEAKELLMEHFLSIRKRMSETWTEETTPITFRQFEALIRLCEAHARILLKDEADVEDAEDVIKIFNKFLSDISFDIGTLEGGPSKSSKEYAIKMIRSIILNKQTSDGVGYSAIIEEAIAKGISKPRAEKALKELINTSSIHLVSSDGTENYYRTSWF